MLRRHPCQVRGVGAVVAYGGDLRWWPAILRGRKKFHKWKRFTPGWPPCIECEVLPATRTCNRCEDPFCDSCYARTHAKVGHAERRALRFMPCLTRVLCRGVLQGKKKSHKFTLVKEELVEGYDYCAQCKVLLGTEECEECHQYFCDACRANVRAGHTATGGSMFTTREL